MQSEHDDFWEHSGFWPRFALGVAASAALAHLAALAGITFERIFVAAAAIHLAVMFLVFAWFLRAARGAFRRPALAPGWQRPIPKWLRNAMVLALACFGLWLLIVWHRLDGGAVQATQAGPRLTGRAGARLLSEAEYRRIQAAVLAAFSASWLTGALGLTMMHARIDQRRRAVRAARPVGAV